MWDRSPNMNDKLLLDRSNVSAFNQGVVVEIDDDINDNDDAIDYNCFDLLLLRNLSTI